MRGEMRSADGYCSFKCNYLPLGPGRARWASQDPVLPDLILKVALDFVLCYTFGFEITESSVVFASSAKSRIRMEVTNFGKLLPAK